MALQTAYRQFLDSPTQAHLAENASLHYITTLVTLNGPEAIFKHLRAQRIQIKKKEEKFLDVVEGHNAVAIEVETTMEFITSGGAYLPGLDDNFVADRTVTLPIIHIVTFDSEGKITQVRQNWDQGSLLKLIDTIGKTGRNWPIRDGKDQIKLISNSVKMSGNSHATSARNPQENHSRSRENSTNVTRDPHASLALFAPRNDSVPENLPAVVAPRASAAPPPRDYHDLFVGQESEQDGKSSHNGQFSSSNDRAIAPKGGQNKNYQPSRLFDYGDENSAKEEVLGYRPHPTKFKHFDLADGTSSQDAHVSQDAPIRPSKTENAKSKHGSSWDFESFKTPEKHIPGKVLRAGGDQHWGNETEDVMDTPIHQKAEPKPRKDAQTHFQFADERTPEPERRIIGRPGAAGMALYRDPVFDDDEPIHKPTLKNITNAKGRMDNDSHFTMKDSSPAANQKENAPITVTSPSIRPESGNGPLKEIQAKGINIAGDGMGSRKGTESSVIKPKGISIGGDGMGGKKGAGRSWGFGDDSDGEEEGGPNARGGKFRNGNPGKAQNAGESNGGGGDFWNY